jgi:hypothetical protein
LIEILLVLCCGCGEFRYIDVVKIFDIFADEVCAYVYFVRGFCSGSGTIVVVKYE